MSRRHSNADDSFELKIRSSNKGQERSGMTLVNQKVKLWNDSYRASTHNLSGGESKKSITNNYQDPKQAYHNRLSSGLDSQTGDLATDSFRKFGVLQVKKAEEEYDTNVTIRLPKNIVKSSYI